MLNIEILYYISITYIYNPLSAEFLKPALHRQQVVSKLSAKMSFVSTVSKIFAARLVCFKKKRAKFLQSPISEIGQKSA